MTQGATCGNHTHQQHHHKHGNPRIPRSGCTNSTSTGSRQCRTRGAVNPAESEVQHPGAHRPRQQVTHHREAIPQHAHHGFRVFLHILEDQAVKPLMELSVEVHLHQAQKQCQTRCSGQPEAHHAALGHRFYAEQGQQQGDAEVHHDPQVKAQTIGERFQKSRRGGVEDHFPVINQQCNPQQGKHHHHDQRA